MDDLLLAGDVGGTKTALGIYSGARGPREPLATTTLPSPEFGSLEALCEGFLVEVGLSPRRAAIGVPGPVIAGRAQATNLPWRIERNRLERGLGLESADLFNDLVAAAHAIPVLEPREVRTISAGRADPSGNMAVVAVGTGLGEAFLSRHAGGWTAHASEGGHADFAPSTELEDGLLSYLRRRYDHVSYERVCSGRGLPNIYDYLKETGFAEEPARLAAALATATHRTPVILESALDGSCALCEATLRMFVSILGRKAGNVALGTLATGGVFLGGGVSPRILPALGDGGFTAAFQGKGRLRPLLEKVPVHVIVCPDVALVGAACRGLRRELGPPDVARRTA